MIPVLPKREQQYPTSTSPEQMISLQNWFHFHSNNWPTLFEQLVHPSFE